MWCIPNYYNSSGKKFLVYIKNENFLFLLFLSSFSCLIFFFVVLIFLHLSMSSPFPFYLFPKCFIISLYICLFIYSLIPLLFCFTSPFYFHFLRFCLFYCLSYSRMPIFSYSLVLLLMHLPCIFTYLLWTVCMHWQDCLRSHCSVTKCNYRGFNLGSANHVRSSCF